MKDGMEMEWKEMMDSMHKMKKMMDDMEMEGMDDMKMEMDKMMERAEKLDMMMKKKDMKGMEDMSGMSSY